NEDWSPDVVLKWAKILHENMGIEILAPSDTIGCASSDSVQSLFKQLSAELPNAEFGVHLHARKENVNELLEAAYSAGCRRFDSAIKGFGGCPMAKDDLTGNIPTEDVLKYFLNKQIETRIDMSSFDNAFKFSSQIFIS
ncbi:MAG: hydroxymethylglutaryl-CoA lyase, partial [Bacteroidota bacterium]